MVALPAVDYTEWPVSSIGKQRETPQPNSATTLDGLLFLSFLSKRVYSSLFLVVCIQGLRWSRRSLARSREGAVEHRVQLWQRVGPAMAGVVRPD